MYQLLFTSADLTKLVVSLSGWVIDLYDRMLRAMARIKAPTAGHLTGR